MVRINWRGPYLPLNKTPEFQAWATLSIFRIISPKYLTNDMLQSPWPWWNSVHPRASKQGRPRRPLRPIGEEGWTLPALTSPTSPNPAPRPQPTPTLTHSFSEGLSACLKSKGHKMLEFRVNTRFDSKIVAWAAVGLHEQKRTSEIRLKSWISFPDNESVVWTSSHL